MEGLNWFDHGIMHFVQTHFHNPFTDIFFTVITFLGEAGAIWLVTALILMFTKKHRRHGVLILCAVAVTYLAGDIILKNIFQRTRPFTDFPDYLTLLIPAPGSYSFPSGHSSSSFAAACAIFYLNKKWGIAAFVLAFFIAFSRIFLFVHYPSDIIAGSLLGLICGACTVFVYKKFIRPRLDQGKP